MSLALANSEVLFAAESPRVIELDLGGNMWTMHQEGESQTLPAVVPGSTYTNLLRAEKIPDPFVGENNGKVQWVAEKNWFFERRFEAGKDLLANRHVELVCHGLDTLATVWLNGRQLGAADNMFRTWTYDLKPHLRAGGNLLRIRFDTLAPYVAQHRVAYKQAYGVDLDNARSWVRKGPYMWGWDWCRPILTQGIWKKIEIVGYDSRFGGVSVLQQHQPDGTVALNIQAAVLGEAAGSTVKAHVGLAGESVAEASGTVESGAATLHAVVAKPQLWWPNGIGDQPLYTVTTELIDAQGQKVDTASRRIGLRTVEVLPPQDGVAMHLRVNGQPVFAKGADWIPADNLPTRVTPEILRYYMTKAVECNFNFIRLWGGGYYEEDGLFDLCDELGLMLQFEFKFANASYPDKDTAWMSNLSAEIEEQTRRCLNHPAIVIWSGNNEIEYFEGYNHIFQNVIGGIVHGLIPGAFYEVGSGAHGSGDIHTWGVWHGDKPAESYDEIEGFVTEFGMQSIPEPATVDFYTAPADRENVNSPVMQYHELDGSGHGIEKILKFTGSNFGKLPENFGDTLWLTQLNQAWTMRYGVEHWRRDMPKSMAAAIWQYNDCWPCATWSMVDYFRRWKAVQYQSKHFFAPVLVSGVLDAKSGRADLYVTSDQPQDAAGELAWSVTNLAGEVLRQGSKQIDLPARTSRMTESLDLSDLAGAQGEANLLVWPEVSVGGQRIAANTLYFGRPKTLKLTPPKLQVHASGGERVYDVLIATDVPALWVWALVKDGTAEYSDNFVDLRRERSTVIRVTLEQPITPFDFRRRLEVRSVYDIAPEMRGSGIVKA